MLGNSQEKVSIDVVAETTIVKVEDVSSNIVDNNIEIKTEEPTLAVESTLGDNSSDVKLEKSDEGVAPANVGIRELKKNAKIESYQSEDKQKLNRLNFLLKKSSVYSDFLLKKLDSLQKEKSETRKEPSEKTGINSTEIKKNEVKVEGVNTTPKKILPMIQARQPKLLTGATLKDYQMDGVDWLISLYENGLNGILADEMGLGKTIQTIAFLSHLIEKGVNGPFIIIVPLSTLTNWMNEFKKFAPSVDCIQYYGTKEERMLLRKRYFTGSRPAFKVTLTSFEVAMRDRSFLQRFVWKYLVVDEGHRLKNFDCKLSRELKKIGASNRLLLTGTPLQNDLTELWSLLNFILPDIFDDMDSFLDWFDIKDIRNSSDVIDENQKKTIIGQLHQILRPFLLRRIKSDVERSLPKKREYILNAYLTVEQKELYQAVITSTLKEYLVESQSKYFEHIPAVQPSIGTIQEIKQSNGEIYEKYVPPPLNRQQMTTKNVGAMRLLNKVMQLRKVCNHPHIFTAPYDKETGEYLYDPVKLINQCGKMLLLDKLLTELIAKGHRVLIFSQMTHVLDILEQYLLSKNNLEYCRIDGSVKQDSRQEQITDFNTDTRIKVFLLSTRAGGLGINLATADTVIFYDSDWNPQADLQAQDRCHRIGQTKPVIIYRLITANTVEGHLIGRANSKRLLEKLVIHKSKFRGLRNNNAEDDLSNEFERLLNNNDYENILIKPGDQLISDTDLERIMDRSEEAYEAAANFLANASDTAKAEQGAFQLYETQIKENNFLDLQGDDKEDVDEELLNLLEKKTLDEDDIVESEDQLAEEVGENLTVPNAKRFKN